MNYFAYFKDISMTSYCVEIITPVGEGKQEITLCDTPVMIETDSNGLFSPIKSRSATINILSGVGMFDLYTTNPLGVQVVVWNMSTGDTLFKGYATPCQYDQTWTSLDTISLECVDVVSALKQIPYQCYDPTLKAYKSLSNVIGRCLNLGGCERYNLYIPKFSLYGCNGYTSTDIQYVMEKVLINEANFFDDDDEQTPWSCYEVLEEICRYLGMTLVPYKGMWALIDYIAVAAIGGNFSNYIVFQTDEQHDYITKSLSKNRGISANDYAGGQSSLSIDDTFNVIEIETNRYDIEEVTDDMMEEDLHISITKEKNFSGQAQPNVWTYYYGNWWAHIGIGTGWHQVRKYLFNRWCRLNQSKTLWRHYWYYPDLLVPNTSASDGSNYYSESVEHSSAYTSLAQNKYINCLGATYIHWAALDNLATKPTKLDWNEAIMFLTMNDTIQGAGCKKGGILLSQLYDYETVAFTYDSDYEMNFSPYEGKSWIVFGGKLWYQQNHVFNGNNDELKIVNDTTHTFVMTPLEDVSDVEPYNFQIETGGVPTFYSFSRSSNHADFGKGFKLMKCKLKIGDKYWAGDSWTTKEAFFYLPFSAIYQDSNKDDKEGFRCFEWMDMVSNTTYEDKVGKNGYCIPVGPTDDVCGQIHIEIYNPTCVPHDTYNGETYMEALLRTFPALNTMEQQWSKFSPCVFLKDFKIDYVYTDASEWYLDEEIKTDDLKFNNSTNASYKMTKSDTVKINSWQEKRPISKSYPIVDVGPSGQRQFLCYTLSPYDSGQLKEQEWEILDKRLRHYTEPRKVYECSISFLLDPWARVQLPGASGLPNIVFVVDSQSYDVRNRNNRVKLIELGDATIHS